MKKILAGCEFFRIVPEEEKRETESPKSEATNKKQIDFGKMKALRNAGWSMKQIAEEMQLAPSTVCGYLKKMEEGK